MKFFQTKLENGLTVIGEQRETAVSVALGFFVKTGARDEIAELSGVSHFLEHMMFKGTATRSTLDISYELARMGAQANAFTGEENTVYYMAVLPEYFSRALELLCDMLRPSLDPGEFDTEKKVILEEIALYRDRPHHVLFESAVKEYFGDHPAGNSVLGSLESVGGITRDMMSGYFESRYRPNNMILAVAGNFRWDELLSLAKRYTGHWARGEVLRSVPLHTPRIKKRELKKEGLQGAHLCLIAPGPSATEETRYAAEVLGCVLGDGTGSKCYWALVDKGLADSAAIDVEDMDGTGMVYGYVSSFPERIDQVGEILRQIMSNPLEFTAEDLDRAKTKIATRLVLQGESSMRRLMSVGMDWIYRKEYLTLDEEIERIRGISIGDIEQMLARYPFQPMTEVRLVPGLK